MLYQLTTIRKDDKDQNTIIYWYCPERLKPVMPYEEVLEDFHLYPDEPHELSELEMKIYYGLLKDHEREQLTELDEYSPDYIPGLDLKQEEVDFYKNFRYTKDEARRSVNEFFSLNEVKLLSEYLKTKYCFGLESEKIVIPVNNVLFYTYCREPWTSDKVPDFVLHDDPHFPLDMPVEGLIDPDHLFKLVFAAELFRILDSENF